jgi:hypothetical protein
MSCECREKIVDGRLGKFASERSLLEQPFIKDNKITVGQHIKETIAKLGETLLPCFPARHRGMERDNLLTLRCLCLNSWVDMTVGIYVGLCISKEYWPENGRRFPCLRNFFGTLCLVHVV